MADTFASLLPEHADKSAYLDGVEAIITVCRTCTTDYNGKVTPAVPALGVQYTVPSFAKDKQPKVQHYSAGDKEHRIPSDDGKRFKVFFPEKHKGLPEDSNARKFVQSILNAPHVSGQGGFPRERISDDVTIFEGMRVKLKAEAQNKTRKVEGQKEDGDDKNRTIILVDQILALPWEGAPQVAAAASPAAAAQAPAQSAAPVAAPPAQAAGSPLQDQNAVSAATDVVVQLLADPAHGGAVDKAKLGPLSFRLLAQNPNRLMATRLLSQNASEFLPTIVGAPVIKGDDMIGTVGFDGSKVTLVKAA